ncbi:MAG: DUF2461 family protein [Lachnospirales bacterium]
MNTFTENTNEFLVGIKFNNNKEWFHQNKELYSEYVHQPMVFLANELCKKFNEFDKSQVLVPRVSRANRDVRFSQNKMPYKISKWFFLRTTASSKIWYPKPTIFFEATMDWWRYGFYYHVPPKIMGEFRKKVYANIAEAERMVDFIKNQNWFSFDGEMYKKVFNKDCSQKANELAQRKWVEFTRYEGYDNLDFYSDELCDVVFEKISGIYELYKYFNNVSEV